MLAEAGCFAPGQEGRGQRLGPAPPPSLGEADPLETIVFFPVYEHLSPRPVALAGGTAVVRAVQQEVPPPVRGAAGNDNRRSMWTIPADRFPVPGGELLCTAEVSRKPIPPFATSYRLWFCLTSRDGNDQRRRASLRASTIVGQNWRYSPSMTHDHGRTLEQRAF